MSSDNAKKTTAPQVPSVMVGHTVIYYPTGKFDQRLGCPAVVTELLPKGIAIVNAISPETGFPVFTGIKSNVRWVNDPDIKTTPALLTGGTWDTISGHSEAKRRYDAEQGEIRKADQIARQKQAALNNENRKRQEKEGQALQLLQAGGKPEEIAVKLGESMEWMNAFMTKLRKVGSPQ